MESVRDFVGYLSIPSVVDRKVDSIGRDVNGVKKHIVRWNTRTAASCLSCSRSFCQTSNHLLPTWVFKIHNDCFDIDGQHLWGGDCTGSWSNYVGHDSDFEV